MSKRTFYDIDHEDSDLTHLKDFIPAIEKDCHSKTRQRKEYNTSIKSPIMPNDMFVKGAKYIIRENTKELHEYRSYALEYKYEQTDDYEQEQVKKHNDSGKTSTKIMSYGRVSNPPENYEPSEKPKDDYMINRDKSNKTNDFAHLGSDSICADSEFSHIIPRNDKTIDLLEKYEVPNYLHYLKHGEIGVRCGTFTHKAMELHNNTPYFSITPSGHYHIFTNDKIQIDKLNIIGIAHAQLIPKNIFVTPAQKIFWMIHFLESVELNKVKCK
jgi:hypothetical protein